MFVRRFADDFLAQVSYLIGCQRTGEAIVIDPPRQIGALLDCAKAEHLNITRVAETHIHADFLSGAREIVEATGAKALLSAEGGPDWQYAWPNAEAVEAVHHGDVITMGGIRLTVRHTPGHTPEHVSYVVTDTVRSEVPVALVSGDFLFVGDVGRPDLLERAAHVSGSMAASARQLFHSIAALKDLPDHVQIWPGHGAGSSCGKALGAMPTSTLGYERLTNWALGVEDEDTFVRSVLEGQPAPPTYFAVMKRMNKAGAPLLRQRVTPQHLPPGTIAYALRDSTVVDIRSAKTFAAGHVKGTLNLPLNKSFLTWSGWFIPYDRPITLIAEDEAAVNAAVDRLASIGLDQIQGYFDPSVIEMSAGLSLLVRGNKGDVLAAKSLQAQGRTIVDVRADSEWEGGHIPGAQHHFLGTIPSTMANVDRSAPVAVHCQGGGRSAVAASVLERLGFTNVIDLPGGYGAWEMAAKDGKPGTE